MCNFYQELCLVDSFKENQEEKELDFSLDLDLGPDNQEAQPLSYDQINQRLNFPAYPERPFSVTPIPLEEGIVISEEGISFNS